MFAVDIAAVLLIGLLVMVLMGVHIAIALGMASALGIYLITGSFAVVERMLASTAYEALRDYVFAVIPQLPLDDDPFTNATGETALALGIGAPVWADPTAEPVAYVPREFPYDGTTLPIVERQDHWVKVLLTGRQAVPSKGDAAQVSGWLRAQDVEFGSTDTVVEVSIAARTVASSWAQTAPVWAASSSVSVEEKGTSMSTPLNGQYGARSRTTSLHR